MISYYWYCTFLSSLTTDYQNFIFNTTLICEPHLSMDQVVFFLFSPPPRLLSRAAFHHYADTPMSIKNKKGKQNEIQFPSPSIQLFHRSSLLVFFLTCFCREETSNRECQLQIDAVEFNPPASPSRQARGDKAPPPCGSPLVHELEQLWWRFAPGRSR